MICNTKADKNGAINFPIHKYTANANMEEINNVVAIDNNNTVTITFSKIFGFFIFSRCSSLFGQRWIPLFLLY